MAYRLGIGYSWRGCVAVFFMMCLTGMEIGIVAASADEGQSSGTVNVSLDPIDGYLIEGFELGIRFETAAGRVIAAYSWNEYVRTLGEPTLDDYYQSVLEQSVPTGKLIVYAIVNVGAGVPPSRPELSGDMPCRLELSVNQNVSVSVFVNLYEEQCLHI